MKVPTSTQEIVIWILLAALTLVFAGLIFFVKRYITTNDEHHKSVDDRLKKIDTKFEDHKKDMNLHAGVMKLAVTDMKEASYTFKKEINDELYKVKSIVSDVASEAKIFQRAVTDMQGTMLKQQESLSLGAKAIVRQREEIENIKTVVKKLSADVTMISQEKKGKI